MAGRIQTPLEPGDEAVRFGGDEFVVLLAGDGSERQIDAWAARLAEHLSARYQLDGTELNTSPSIGIAIAPRDAQEIDTLIRYADGAMYSAKRAGRGQYRFFDPSLNCVNSASVRRCASTSSCCTISRRSAWTRWRCAATRRWCAGNTLSSAWFTRAGSSAWPNAAALLVSLHVAIANLEALRDAGLGISLDDFGKGYACFAHLHSLPITKLKIDRSLIAQLSNKHDDSLIVASTITQAKRLSLRAMNACAAA